MRCGRVAIGVTVVALLATACGGGSGGSATGPTRTTRPEPNTTRPEGPWTFIAADTSRSDAPDAPKGHAAELHLSLEPACAEGPCDIAVTPNGVDGTALPKGYPRADEADPTPFEPFELTWDEESRTYTRTTSSTAPESCTNPEGTTIDSAYDISRTWTLEFRTPDGERPASLVGTYSRKLTATPAGAAAGCHSFDQAGTLLGAPTGSLEGDAAANLAAGYVLTLAVEKTERGEPPWIVGNSFAWNAVEEPIKVEKSGEGFAITGVFGGTAPLSRGASGWDATIQELDPGCGPEAPVTETYSGLHPVAMSQDGSFVLAGSWSLVYTLTPGASPEACQPSTDTAYVILVPVQALTGQP